VGYYGGCGEGGWGLGEGELLSIAILLALLSFFVDGADFFCSTGHDDRVRRRAGRLFALEHGLDRQARNSVYAAGLGCRAQGLS
jgi:hypothetical protein